jgi:hypothetical protein
MAEILFAGLVFALSAVLLRNLGWRGAPVFAVLALIVLLSELPVHLGALFSVSELAFAGKSGEAIAKIIGIGYLFGISSELCRELGESAIASGLVIAGRLEIIGVSVPFLGELIEGALSIIGEI